MPEVNFLLLNARYVNIISRKKHWLVTRKQPYNGRRRIANGKMKNNGYITDRANADGSLVEYAKNIASQWSEEIRAVTYLNVKVLYIF